MTGFGSRGIRSTGLEAGRVRTRGPMPLIFWILFAAWYGGLLLALAWEVASIDRKE